MMRAPIDAGRLLDLAISAGIDFLRTSDGGVKIRGPQLAVDALGPQLQRIGRAAIMRELDALDVDARRRLGSSRERP